MTRQTKQAKRFSFRFSLFRFLVFVVGSGTALGVWSLYVEPIRTQWRDAEPLLRSGFVIGTQPSDIPRWMTVFLPAGKRDFIFAVSNNGKVVSDRELQALKRMPRLGRLELSKAGLNDEQCQELAQIETLQRLLLSDNQISDEGAKFLAVLPHLDYLDLSDNPAVTWRTNVFYHQNYQQNPALNLQSSFGGSIQEDLTFSQLQQLAILHQPLYSIRMINPSDDQLDQLLNDHPKLHSVTLTGRGLQASRQGLSRLINRVTIRYISFAQHLDPEQQPETSSTLEKIFASCGDGASKMLFKLDRSAIRARFFRDRFDSDTAHLEIATTIRKTNGLGFKNFAGLDDIRELEIDFESQLPESFEILGALPNLQHLVIKNIGWEFPRQCHGALTELDSLMSLEMHARSSWEGFQIPDSFRLNFGFFEDWSCLRTLRAVRLYSCDISDQQLRPLLDYPNLSQLLIRTAKMNPASAPEDYLEELQSQVETENRDGSFRQDQEVLR